MPRPGDWLATQMRASLRSWRTRLWFGGLALVALALTRMPLFGILGFEFSFVFAVLGSVAAADLSAAMVRQLRQSKAPALDRHLDAWRLILGLTGRSLFLGTLPLLLPLAIVSFNGLWQRNCDWLFGVQCYVLMSLFSTWLAGLMGAALALLVPPRRRWLGAAAPYAALLLSVLLSLLHFYNSPAVFSYNPFGGYFPGNLYDENIDLRAPFYWARAFQLSVVLAAAAALTALVDVPSLRLRWQRRPLQSRPLAILTFVSSALLAMVLWSKSGALGFSISVEDIRAALPGVHRSEHFVIHYPPIPEIADDIERIADEHEFRRAQLVRDLGVEGPALIHSYYFHSPEQKFQLMGARNVYMAKPWRREIYLNHQAFPHQVLRHEIAHVVAGSFGDPIFEVAAGRLLGLPLFFNVGLIEGTAVASDWPDHFDKALTPHQSVKAMQSLGWAPPTHRLFSTGFLSFASGRSYTVAGSFLRFLLDEYGAQPLRAVYRNGGDFMAAYGKSQRALIGEWQRFIDAIDLPEEDVELIKERFRSPGIFKRPCPHTIARKREAIHLAQALGELDKAIRIGRSICDDSGGEPRYELMLAGLLERRGEREEARAIFSRIADDSEHMNSSLRAHATFQLVNMAARAGRYAEAIELLATVAKLPLPDDEARQAHVQLEVLRHQGPAGPALRSLFWGPGTDSGMDRLLLVARAAEALLQEPAHPLAHYLLGRQLSGRGAPEETCRSFERALDGNLHPLVRREAARLLAQAAYLATRDDSLLRAVSILVEPDQPEVVRLTGYDWLERMRWRDTGALPAEALGWNKGQTRSGMPSNW